MAEQRRRRPVYIRQSYRVDSDTDASFQFCDALGGKVLVTEKTIILASGQLRVLKVTSACGSIDCESLDLDKVASYRCLDAECVAKSAKACIQGDFVLLYLRCHTDHLLQFLETQLCSLRLDVGKSAHSGVYVIKLGLEFSVQCLYRMLY